MDDEKDIKSRKTFATGNAGVEQKVNRIFRTRHEIDDDSIFNTETFFLSFNAASWIQKRK